MEAHLRGRYRALPLIATPLEQVGEHGQHHGNPSESSFDSETDLKSGGHIGDTAVIRKKLPAFRGKEEASTIELFYDLFFVANLTSFTTVHTIDSKTSKSLFKSLFLFHLSIKTLERKKERKKKWIYIY